MSAKAQFNQIKKHRESIEGSHFLLPTENPKFPDKKTLSMDHEAVLKNLQGAGYEATTVESHHGVPEKTVLIKGVTPEHAEKLHGLASRLGQDSSIYSDGQNHEMKFHHGEHAGKSVKGSGTVHHLNKPDDFFTTLPGGVHHFTHNFDFSKGPQ